MNSHMWNLKNKINTETNKAATKSQIEQTDGRQMGTRLIGMINP